MVIPYKREVDKEKRVPWGIDTTMGAALLSCDRMTKDTLDYIAKMPDSLVVSFEGMSPIYLQHKMPLTTEKIEELKRIGCKDILTAHTHESHDNTYGDFHLMNPGSVGLPDNGIQGASYGVLTWRNQHWRMERQHISYDYEKQKKLIRESSTLMEHCKHWGYALIAAIDTGINVPALYMFEVKQIAKEYAENKDKEKSFQHDISLGIGRYGNINPYRNYLESRIIIGDKIGALKFETDEFLPSSNFAIEDWMYDIALKNVLTSLYVLKKEEKLKSGEAGHGLLMDIRNGKYLDGNRQPSSAFYELLDEYEKRLEYAKNNTGLPEKPDYKKIDEFRMYVNESIVKGEV